MKPCYTTSGHVQAKLTEAHRTRGINRQFPDIIHELIERGETLSERPALPFDEQWGHLPDDMFIQLLNALPIDISSIGMRNSIQLQESDILPAGSDVFVFKHFNHINNRMHKQDYFEIGYVFRGRGQMIFEKEQINLEEGNLFIIAPMSLHDVVIDDDDAVTITVLIRKSTFEDAFFSLLSRQDMLSGFFRTILYQQPSSNYLLFDTSGAADLKPLAKNLVMENYRDDIYANHCCISWVNLLFAMVLRRCGDTIRFYNDQAANAHFPQILQHIQHHFRTLTLRDLADFFHYSEAHLCTLIGKNTGMTFTTLVNRLKIAKAVEYLENTDLTVAEIAEYVGYHSADHFSRTFRKSRQASPQQFRRARRT